MRHQIEIIFGRTEDDRAERSGMKDEQGNILSPFATDQFESSRALGFTAMNPKHSEPTLEERFGMKVFSLGLFYKQFEEREAQALLAIKQALTLNPYLSEAWYKLGSYHMINRNPESAIESLEKCISLSPRFLPAYSDIAAALIVIKNYPKAIGYSQKALEIDAENTPTIYNKGICHQSLQDWKEAIECYEKILRLTAAHRRQFAKDGLEREMVPIVNIPNVVHALAQCYDAAESTTGTNRINQAPPNYFLTKSAEMLEEYVVDEPKDERAYCMLGCAYVDMHKYSAAQDAFKNALNVNPESLDAHGNLGMMLFAEGHFDTSLAHLEHALDLDPTLYQLHINAGHVRRMRGDIEGAVKHYMKAIEIVPGKASGIAYLHLGILLFNAKQFESAKPYLDEAIKHYPQSIEAHYHMALYYKTVPQNSPAARTHFEVAYRLTLASMPASQRLCFKLLDEANYTAFNKTLYKELTDSSNIGSTTYNHVQFQQSLSPGANSGNLLQLTSINAASLLQETERIADAIRVYQTLLQASPRYFPAQFNLAKCYESNGALDKAIEHFSLAVEISPKLFEAQFHLGNALATAGQFDKALTYLKEAVELNKNSALAWHSLADCQTELGQYRTAQQSFNHASRLNPKDPECHVGIGVCFYHLKRYRDAEMAYRQAIEISNSQNPLAFYNLSSTLVALGRSSEALEALEKTVQLDPTFPHAHFDIAVSLMEEPSNLNKPEKIERIKQHLNTALQYEPALIERVPLNMKPMVLRPKHI
jgi:tetratricopeptide (TPR) repeat protein